MKKIALALVFALMAGYASAQTFPLGNIPLGKGPAAQGWTPLAPGAAGNCVQSSGGTFVSAPCIGSSGVPGGAVGAIQYNNAGAFGGFVASGDFTINTTSGVGTLASVNSNVGSFGSAGNCTIFTVNAKGLITAASTVSCPAVTSLAATAITYTAPWTSAVTYPQNKVDDNVVRMTDFMGTTTCDGVMFVGGTGGVSTTTLTVASVQMGSITAGMTVGSGAAQRLISSQLTGPAGGAGTYQMNSAATVTNGTYWNGGTDQAANMQAFLNAVAANGPLGRTTTGKFAPGNCYVTATPTFTVNSSQVAVNYHLDGYGTTISPSPASTLTAFKVVRGTYTSFGDESRTTTIEGLTYNVRNNGNVQWGVDVGETRTYLIRNNCRAGDDGVTHAQVNFACYYWHQIDPADPATGAFYGKLFQSTCKGNGTGVSAVPICLRVDGSGGNALVVAENAFAQGIYGMRILNPCATVNANCAYHPNNVIVRDNNIELFSTCIEMRTSVPTLSKLIGGVIEGNTLELCSISDVDLTTFTQQSNANQALAIGPNTGIGTVAAIANPNAIQVILPNAKQWP